MQQPDKCSDGDAVQPQNDNIVQPAPMPIQPEANIPGPAEPAGPSHDNDQVRENVGGVQIDQVLIEPANAPDPDMPVIEIPDEAPVEQPMASAPVKQPEAAEDMLNDPLEEKGTSTSSETTSSFETSSTETSDEDNLPLVLLYNSGPATGRRVAKLNAAGRYPPGLRPLEARRLGSLPTPPRPILTQPPIRPLLPDGDDASLSSDEATTRSKRRRLIQRRQ